jgi:hypothetical protein
MTPDCQTLKTTELEYFDIGADDISGDFHKVNYTPVFKSVPSFHYIHMRGLWSAFIKFAPGYEMLHLGMKIHTQP